jgi:hypothetical protein
MKLGEYYSHEGVDDPIVVDLPKGSYALTFHLRAATARPGPVDVSATPLSVNPPKAKPAAVRAWAIAVIVLAGLLATSLVICAVLVARLRAPGVSTVTNAAPAPFQIFWNRFVAGPQQPWVIFSNASFVGQPQTNMHYFNPVSDSRATILDHYTGVGEVLAVHQLDHVFSLMNGQLQVKRGALFSLDDAKNNDLIFIGSPAENLTLLEIPGTQEFVFHRMESGLRKGDMEVVNVHPHENEPKSFMASPSNNTITEDYSVVALVPGIDPVRSMLILAGTTTMGTQAAAEFVCREDSLKELLQRLGVSRPEDLKPFEALLRVKVTHGVPVKTELIALRTTAAH